VAGPPEAFLVGTEFAHLHGARDGSLHVALPTADATLAIEKGWAELHPLARPGVFPPTLVMLYGPRDEAELETIWQLVQISYAFARG
jgi:phospholipase/carboxylesterase